MDSQLELQKQQILFRYLKTAISLLQEISKLHLIDTWQ